MFTNHGLTAYHGIISTGLARLPPCTTLLRRRRINRTDRQTSPLEPQISPNQPPAQEAAYINRRCMRPCGTTAGGVGVVRRRYRTWHLDRCGRGGMEGELEWIWRTARATAEEVSEWGGGRERDADGWLGEASALAQFIWILQRVSLNRWRGARTLLDFDMDTLSPVPHPLFFSFEGSSLSGRGVSSQLTWDPTRTLDGDDDVVVDWWLVKRGRSGTRVSRAHETMGTGKRVRPTYFFRRNRVIKLVLKN